MQKAATSQSTSPNCYCWKRRHMEMLCSHPTEDQRLLAALQQPANPSPSMLQISQTFVPRYGTSIRWMFVTQRGSVEQTGEWPVTGTYWIVTTIFTDKGRIIFSCFLFYHYPGVQGFGIQVSEIHCNWDLRAMIPSIKAKRECQSRYHQ